MRFSIRSILSIVVFMVLLTSNALADNNHWMQVEQHTKESITATDNDSIVKHAEEAKKHALAAKSDPKHKVNSKLMDEGINYLDIAIREGKNGNKEAAQKAAKDAIYTFEQAAK